MVIQSKIDRPKFISLFAKFMILKKYLFKCINKEKDNYFYKITLNYIMYVNCSLLNFILVAHPKPWQN